MPAYTYSLSGHFSSGLDGTLLGAEVLSSSISQEIASLLVDGDVVELSFPSALTTAEQTTLDSLVGAHPTSTEDLPEAQEVSGTLNAYVENEVAQTTTSESFTNALTLTTPELPNETATYRVAWYYEWAVDSTSDDFIARVQLDDSSTIAEHRQEAKDASGSSSSGSSSGTNQRHCASGFKHISLTQGVHAFTLDIRAEDDNEPVTVYRARMEFWRVS